MARPRRDPLLAQRKIYFCKAQHGQDLNREPALDRQALVQAITALQGSNDFYLADGDPADEQQLCAVVDRDRAPERLRFYRVRRRDLPETEASGVFHALELGERDGLAESIHLVFFDDDIVGAEYNHYGPRATTFGRFLQERCDQDVRLRYLIRADVINQILGMSEIRRLRIKVEPSAASALSQQAGGLGGAFEAAELFQAGRYMDLTVAGQPADPSFTDRVKGLLRNLRDQQSIERLDTFEVYGRTANEELQSLSLFSDRVIVQSEIQKESVRSRALDKDSAYRAVEEAYRSLEGELDQAGTIAVG